MARGSMQQTLDYLCEKFGHPSAYPVINLPDFSRADLARLFCELGYKVGVELGVETGKFSETLLSNNPGLKLYCCDAWKAYRGYREHVSQDKLDGFLERTKERLQGYDFEIIRKFSHDGVKKFKDGELDFVYLDGNHTFDHIMHDLIVWGRKVKSGNLICGHDYFYPGNNDVCRYGVIDAVDAYTKAHGIQPLFIARGDAPKAPSFFFVKE